MEPMYLRLGCSNNNALAASSAASAPVLALINRMKVTVNQWVPVAVWKWPKINGNDDVCGICRSQFEATCPTCLTPGHGCPPLSGKCSHSFHQHCIEKWLRRDESEWSCPMCRRPFVVSDSDSEIGAREDDIEMEQGSGDSSMAEASLEGRRGILLE